MSSSEYSRRNPDVVDSLTIATVGTALVRHWLIGLLVAAAAGAAVYWYLMNRDAMYRASASVSFYHAGEQAGAARGGPDIGLINTERDDLTSAPRLRQVIESMKLEQERPYRSVLDPVGVFGSRLSTQSSKDTWILRLSLIDEFPQRAENMLGELIRGYLVDFQKRLQKRTTARRAYLIDELQGVDATIERLRQEGRELRQEFNVLSREPDRNRFTKRLDELQRRHQSLETEQKERSSVAEAFRQRAEEGDWQDLLIDLSSVSARIDAWALLQQHWELWRASQRLFDQRSQTYGEKHQLWQQAAQELSLHREQLTSLVSSLQKHAEAAAAAADRALAASAQELDQAVQSVGRYRTALARLAAIEAELADAQRSRARLGDLRAEQEMNERLASTGPQLVSPPRVGSRPFNKDKRVTLLLAVFLGLLAGSGSALILEWADRVLRADRVGQWLQAPVVAQFPQAKSLGRRGDLVDLLAADAMREPVRLLAAMVTQQAEGDRGTAVAITSAVAGDGKTTVAVLLAVALARAGKQVLLVDADLRLGRLYRVFGLSEQHPGFTFVVDGSQEIEAIETDVPGMSVLPSGPLPPEPLQLLHSGHFPVLVQDWTARYDFILFDTAPVGAAVDAAVVARHVDQLLFVVRDGKTPRTRARQAMQVLEGQRHKLLGVVVNGARDISVTGPYQS